jgi:hypothetical protein
VVARGKAGGPGLVGCDRDSDCDCDSDLEYPYGLALKAHNIPVTGG